MRQKENRPSAGDAYGTVPFNCINDITDMCESQSIAYDDLLEAVTLAYLSDIDADLSPDFSTVKVELLEITNDCIEKYNLGRPDENVPTTAKKSERYPDAKKPEARYRRLTALHPLQIAILIRELHHGVGILWNKAENEGNFDIGIYQTDGENEGCYDTRDEILERLIRSYDKTMSLRGVDETVAILRSICKRVERCSDRDLIPVNNGIFDYKNKILLGFDPEYVFTSKSKVDYVPNAVNPIIHNDDDGTDWDVVSWMDELSDDPEIVDLLWEVTGAAIRPGVSWEKTAWFYSTLGNNGKGTLCTLIRNLCGRGTWASVPLKAFSQQFLLEPLTRVSAIITDENDTGTFVDDAAALKSVITCDPFQINRKYKDPRTVKFRGFMIQCVNELPKLKDKSESMYRRLLVIPFEKRFEGIQRKYAEYMRTVHGVDSTTGMTGEANFNRSVAANPVSVISETEFARLNLKAKHEGLTPSELQMYNDYAQANMAKRGGGVTPSMSTGKLVAIVVGVIFIILLLWFAFDYTQNAPVNKTLGTILMYGNLLISN